MFVHIDNTSVGFSWKKRPEFYKFKSVYRLIDATEKVAESLVFQVRLKSIHTLAIKKKTIKKCLYM